ncbi:MAG: cyclic pyranopterin monophosphate synthase MoaC [Cyclobacteriaceae bacterium]|nr:cyclic pyranopterin monophosphate synthase MoaC [Cyclobacteriaceae bacterium]
MKRKLSHVGPSGNPRMVNVSAKKVTLRTAQAQAKVWLGRSIIRELKQNELMSAKGPVFQTAILAGIQGAKKTADLIPLCHPLGLDDCSVTIHVEGEYAIVNAAASLAAKTGVEMEALTAAAVASLTIYDMCKALSHDIRIESIQLMSKKGGKRDFTRQ